ncbi:unnamed protein product [Orchesella dallaii]|uniref:Reverse transcriptase domain-containing protein n=1 Tax=Orchesella dallaii TaxID=48710 RepID=A0ABP1S1M3_9HEXA
MNELLNMCGDSNLELKDMKLLPNTTFTFCSKGQGHTSWPDHFAISQSINVVSCSVLSDANPSDHYPIAVNVKIKCDVAASNKEDSIEAEKKNLHVKWQKLPTKLKLTYANESHEFLSSIDNTYNLCQEPGCSDENHKSLISTYINCIITAFKCSEQNIIAIYEKQLTKHKHRFIAGWNSNVKVHYLNYKESHARWISSGRSDAFQYETMKRQRTKFRCELNRCRKNKERILRDNLAKSYSGNNFYDFWQTVKRQDGVKRSDLSATVEGVNGHENISEMWAQHYKHTFNSNSDDKNENFVTNYIERRNKVFLSKKADPDIVIKAINSLSSGKAIGSDGLSAENLKFAVLPASQAICKAFNSALCHGFVPEALMRVQIVPILKKSGLDATSSNNYRPIAIASVISKVFEKLILLLFPDKFHTAPNQFGYKKDVGTEVAVFSLKQIAHHYLRHNTPVYVCYLDATKAFDMVNHWTLLKKLCERDVDIGVIQFLKYWFRNQFFTVKWGKCVSSPFPVRNSVRQGGVLSASLFAIYMDDLCVQLTKTGLGCRIGDLVVNNLCYADDICLLTTTIYSLKMLLKICEEKQCQSNVYAKSCWGFQQHP